MASASMRVLMPWLYMGPWLRLAMSIPLSSWRDMTQRIPLEIKSP